MLLFVSNMTKSGEGAICIPTPNSRGTCPPSPFPVIYVYGLLYYITMMMMMMTTIIGNDNGGR